MFFLPKTTSKRSWKDMLKYSTFSSLEGTTSEMALSRMSEW